MNINKKATLLALLLALSCVVVLTPPTAVGTQIQSIITTPAAVGRQPDITVNFELSPGDAVAPHLYDLYFDGVDDRVLVSDSGSLDITQAFTITTILADLSLGYLEVNTYPVLKYKEGVSYYGLVAGWGTRPIGVGINNGTHTYRTSAYSLPDNNFHFIRGIYDYGGAKLLLYVDNNLMRTTSVPQGFTIPPNTEPLYIYHLGARRPYKISFVTIHAKVITGEFNIVDSNELRIFLDPTFFNGTHFLDLSGNGNHGRGYNGVARIPSEIKWLYLVKGLHGDGLVHFRFFPRYSTVYLYDGAGMLKYVFVVDGPTNQVGLVEDFAIQLPPDTYTVRVYLDWAMPAAINVVAFTNKQWYGLGENVILRAEVIDAISGARMIGHVSNVSTFITLPDGTQYNVSLSDDGVPPDDVGGDGVFHGVFTSTQQVGTYFFEVRAVVGAFEVVGLGSFAVGSIAEEIQSTMMSWHDPSLMQRVVWVGTAVMAVSIAFTLFALYSAMVRTGWVARHRMLVILGGWTLVFTIQLAYIATNPVVVYGVLYNVTSKTFEYSTAPNPMLTPVIGVTLVTGVVSVAAFLTGYLRDQFVRMRRRYAQL